MSCWQVKTPEGAIQSPAQKPLDHGAGGDTDQKDKLEGKVMLPNAEFEFRPEEGGFGPISILLRTLLPGRYHVYAKCEPYEFAGKHFGWSDSNAQIYMYGHDQDDGFVWEGNHSFKCKKDVNEDAAGKRFWDVCFFEVAQNGQVIVDIFSSRTCSHTQTHTYVHTHPHTHMGRLLWIHSIHMSKRNRDFGR